MYTVMIKVRTGFVHVKKSEIQGLSRPSIRKFKDQWAEKKALESSEKSRKKLLKLQKMSQKLK